MTNYKHSDKHTVNAWKIYKALHPKEDHSVLPFVAGFNAAMETIEKLNDDNVMVNKGALQMVFNVLERDGGIRQEIADELRKACKLIEL